MVGSFPSSSKAHALKRTDSIPDAVAAIQELGRQHGFDCDVNDDDPEAFEDRSYLDQYDTLGLISVGAFHCRLLEMQTLTSEHRRTHLDQRPTGKQRLPMAYRTKRTRLWRSRCDDGRCPGQLVSDAHGRRLQRSSGRSAGRKVPQGAAASGSWPVICVEGSHRSRASLMCRRTCCLTSTGPVRCAVFLWGSR